MLKNSSKETIEPKSEPSILIFSATTPLANGGVKKFSDEILKGLQLTKHNALALFGRKSNNLITSFFDLVKRYRTFLKEAKVVHFVSLSPYNIPFLIIAKLQKKRIIVTYHGIYSEELSVFKKPHMLLLYWIADMLSKQFADVIVSPSAYLAKKLKLHDAIIIPNPIDIQSLDHLRKETTSADEEIIIVTSSNFNIKKKADGLYYLLRAMDNIGKDFGHVKLLVFGDGEELQRFKSESSHRTNVMFMGFRDDFLSFLASARAYIHVSGLDNQPYSLIEALILGKVILCNNLDSLSEMIDKNSNYLVSLNSISITEGIFSLITDIINDSEMVNNKGKQNRRLAVETYSTEVITRKYLGIYRDIT